MAVAVELKAVPPREAIAFFRQKGYRTTFSYLDMMHAAHGQAFTVAGVTRLDVLQDLRTIVDEAIVGGSTLAQFKATAQEKLAAKGWWGPVKVKDPVTGDEKIVDLSSSRRLQIIFNTNLRTSYAAGHWARIQRTKAALPYLRYSAVLDKRTRPLHRAWNNTVLPVDDPWWDTHYPPNGWNCRCTVVEMTGGQVERAGLRVQPEGPMDGPDQVFTNRRTGETFKVPRGIDPSFAYNVGRTASFPDPARYAEPAFGRQAALLSVASDGFEALVARKVSGTAPVAWVDDVLMKALRADVRRVDLSSETLAKQLDRHPEIGLDEYRQLPELLQDGLVVDDGSGEAVRIYALLPNGKPYVAIVKRTGTGQALFVVSFYRANPRDLQAALAAPPIRDAPALRTALAGGTGAVE
jgi:SPP1 gp7 family putative phage head morphogenesis protein